MARSRPEPQLGRIEATTHDGRGIVAGDGKKVFVAGALDGEHVRYLRRRRRRNYDEAELIEVLEPAAERVAPRCAVFGRCGGCALQHVSTDMQLSIKSQSLKDSLERIGRVEPARWLDPLTGEPWLYRRRARLAVKDVPGKGRVLVGFRERHAPFITDMTRCEVIARPVDSLIAELSELIGGLSVRARLPQIEVAVADNAVALVFRVLDPPTAADIERLRAFGDLHELNLWLQRGGPDALELVWPDADSAGLRYSLPDFDVDIGFEPTDFVQVNAAVNRRMVQAAIDYLELRADDRVLDLFCGIGNFSLPLARRAGHVLGIEGETAMVERARANARQNGIDNVEFQRADLAAIDGSERFFKSRWDCVLLDPARTGAVEIAARMRKLGPRRIVYVSCHPGTLARDAGTLVNELGYTLAAAGIIDMFPHTAHVESVAIFDK